MRWLLLLPLVWMAACGNSEEKLKKFAKAGEAAAERGKDVTLIYSDSAIITARVEAPVLLRYSGEKPKTEMPEGIKASFYNSAGQPNSWLTANRAIQHPNEGITEAHGNVIVVNELGDTLYTEKLIWVEKEDRIYTNTYVRIVRPDEIIFGDGLESNQQFTRYKILNIKGTIALNQEVE